MPTTEKLYYIDEVVRHSADNGAYQVFEQVGLERIGREDAFANVEVLDLALRSLTLLGRESAMDVSHLGFVSGLFEDAGLPPQVERDILAAVHAKSIHDAAARLEAAGVSNGRRERILALAGLHGSFSEVLSKARALVRGSRMTQAYEELEILSATLRPGQGQVINLDFSVVNDLDYYNGLIFRGYLKGIPGVVCSGGRYDNLMKRLGKDSSAIGFAVFLHQLEALCDEENLAVDVLLLYADGCSYAKLLAEAERLSAQGMTVRCEREDCDLASIPHAKLILMKGEG